MAKAKKKDSSSEDVITHKGVGGGKAAAVLPSCWDETGTLHNPALQTACICREVRITPRNERMCVKCWPLPGAPTWDHATVMAGLLRKFEEEEAAEALKKRK